MRERLFVQITRNTYAYVNTSSPTRVVRKMLCLSVNRSSSDCCLTVIPVATPATAIDCTLIILPIMPPEEFAAFADVSDPVRNTSNQPRNGLQKGNALPVAAKAKPRLPVAPE
jgi:hypothetical protein